MPLIAPIAIVMLCVVAGIATVLLLPNGRENSLRKIGGVILAAVGLIFVGIIIHATAGQDVSGTGAYFWIFSAIALVGAVRVVTHPRPVFSALYFVLTVFASAGLFVLLYAEFMAAALVIIYAGAILITYVFVIMLASTATNATSKQPLAELADCDMYSREPYAAACIGFALMGVLLFAIFDKAENLRPMPKGETAAEMAAKGDEEQVHGSTQYLGKYLFESQLVNLELAGVILTVSMIGAIIISRRRVTNPDDAYEPTSETVTANMTPVDDDPHSIPVYGTTNPRQKAFPQS